MQILLLRQIINQIKHALPTEPTRLMTARHFPRVQRLLLRDLIRLTIRSRSRSISQQLYMAALVEEVEPADSLLDRLADGQETVVAEECSTLVAESDGDVVAFVFGEDDALAVEDDVVLVSCQLMRACTVMVS